MAKLKIYRDGNGDQPYVQWLEKLDNSLRKDIESRVLRLTHNPERGTFLRNGVYELQDHSRAGYRVYYGIIGEKEKEVFLLGGGTKSSKKKQDTEIDNAIEGLKEVIEEKKRREREKEGHSR